MTNYPRRRKNALSRREFLKIAAAGLLVGCSSPAQTTPSSELTQSPATPTSEPTAVQATATETPAAATATRPPTRTATPTFTPLPSVATRRPEVIKAYPDVRSKVVHTHHAGVWNGTELVPDALRQMLDASITDLTGLNDAREAWRALFDPGERIAIKVNAFRNSVIWTHPPLVQVVTSCLQEIGVPAENIFIFDYDSNEMKVAGYAINRDNPGIRCYGTDNDYSSGFEVAGSEIELSNIMLSCNALINMPVLKSHMLTGLSFALKNHYGTLRFPEYLHSRVKIQKGLPELNALPAIRDRTRLIIGDALQACLRYSNSWPYWEADYTGDSILMSFDPVAHDALGFKIFTDALAADGGDTASAIGMATPWFEYATSIGLGTNNFDDMDIVEKQL